LKYCKRFKIPEEEVICNNESIEKIYKELSVNNVVKRIREARILSLLTLNKHHRRFMPFLVQNLIRIDRFKGNNDKTFKKAITYNKKEFTKFAHK